MIVVDGDDARHSIMSTFTVAIFLLRDGVICCGLRSNIVFVVHDIQKDVRIHVPSDILTCW